MTNSLTIVAKVFSNTQIFLLQKCNLFSAKNINVFAIHQDRNLNVFNIMLANNFVNF